MSIEKPSATLMSALVAGFRMVMLLLLAKGLAVLMGPAGMALYGNVQNVMGIAHSMGARSLESGVVRYTAEGAKVSLEEILRSSFQLSALGIIVWFVGILLFFHTVESLIETSLTFWILLGLVLSAFVSSFLIIATARLQGLEHYYTWAGLSMLVVLIQLLFILGVVRHVGPHALVTAYILTPLVQVVLLIPLLRSSFSWRHFFGPVHWPSIKRVGSYLLMGFVSAGSLPVALLILRGYLGHHFSFEVAGLWQALWGLSSQWIGLVTAIFATTYLPRLVKREGVQERAKLVHVTLKISALVSAVGLLIGWALREPLVTILFTVDFLPITSAVGVQFLGAFFQVLGWVLGMIMIAQGRMKLFVTLELLFLLFFVVTGILFARDHGIVGLAWAYVLESLLYVITLAIVYRKELSA